MYLEPNLKPNDLIGAKPITIESPITENPSPQREPYNINDVSTDYDIQNAESQDTQSAKNHPPYNNVFDLVPYQNPDTISLNDALVNLKGTQKGKETALDIIAKIESATNIDIPDTFVDNILDNLELLTNLLQFDGKTLSLGSQGLILLGPSGSSNASDHNYQLGNTFDYAKFDEVEVDLPSPELKEITDGLYQGWPRNPELSDEQIKSNIILAEVFDRLSNNTGLEDANKFKVIYNGSQYDNLDSFVNALANDGYEVSAEIEHRVANFLGLHAMGEDGQIKEVAAPFFVKTGIKDDQGNEAVLPMFHSEIVFHVKPKDDNQQGAINASTKFYQGSDRTGFFGDECSKSQKWAGENISKQFSGEEALRALKLSGLLTNVIQASSESHHLPNEGYGATGVCNDSVAVIQQAITGETFPYPLMMNDDLLTPELEQRLAELQNDPEHQNEYKNYDALLTAIKETPSDNVLNDTAALRALLSMPWKEGSEPFLSTVEARRIITEYLERKPEENEIPSSNEFAALIIE